MPRLKHMLVWYSFALLHSARRYPNSQALALVCIQKKGKMYRFAKVSSANSNMGIVIVIFIILNRNHSPILSITHAYTPCLTCTRQLPNSSHPIYTYSPHAPLQLILIHLHPIPRIIRARPLVFQRHNRAVDPLDIRSRFRPCMCYAFHRGFDA
jgi:hypothetical protein